MEPKTTQSPVKTETSTQSSVPQLLLLSLPKQDYVLLVPFPQPHFPTTTQALIACQSRGYSLLTLDWLFHIYHVKIHASIATGVYGFKSADWTVATLLHFLKDLKWK